MTPLKRIPNYKCKICNTDCYKRRCDIDKGRVYCSHQCYLTTRRKYRKCLECNELIPLGKHKVTCSRACANKAKIGLKYRKLGRPPKDKVTYLNGLRDRLTKLRGFVCERCGYSKYPILQVHHKIQVCNGGSDELDNLELICPLCHAEEHYLRRLAKKQIKEMWKRG